MQTLKCKVWMRSTNTDFTLRWDNKDHKPVVARKNDEIFLNGRAIGRINRWSVYYLNYHKRKNWTEIKAINGSYMVIPRPSLLYSKFCGAGSERTLQKVIVRENFAVAAVVNSFMKRSSAPVVCDFLHSKHIEPFILKRTRLILTWISWWISLQRSSKLIGPIVFIAALEHRNEETR